MVDFPAPEPETPLLVQYLGKDKSHRRVYKDASFAENKVLVGYKGESYKGESYMDSGYFYAPYIPVTKKPVILDPASFEPRRGILTRYGKKLLEQGRRFYGKLELKAESDDFSSVSTTLELK